MNVKAWYKYVTIFAMICQNSTPVLVRELERDGEGERERGREREKKRNEKEEVLTMKIGTWLNDILGETAKKLFFNKSMLSDLTFSVDGKDMYLNVLYLTYSFVLIFNFLLLFYLYF